MFVPKWIWRENTFNSDSYVRFKKDFIVEDLNGKVFIDISCDTFYNLYVNSKLVNFGWFFDFDHYKMMDKVDISNFVKEGNNTIEIVVWYMGVPSFNYTVSNPGLYFLISNNEKTIAVSNSDVLCKIEDGYKQENNVYINNNLGLSFLFDNNIKAVETFSNCIEIDKKVVFANTDRKIKNLVLEEKKFGTVRKTQKNHFLVDLSKVYYGFVSFDFVSKKANNEIKVYFGEYLKNDTLVGKYVGDDKFSFTFIAKEGENYYENLFRALGCRYFEFVCDDIEELSCAISPIVYPFEVKPFKCKTDLQQEIYEKCLYTLKCCTNKHYIDCPWREQAMYILDSRNQMLIGYTAFEGFELQKFNLKFLSKGISSDGLIPPSPPGSNKRIIPFFNLIYIIQVFEYYQNTKDIETLKDIENALDSIINNFLKRINLEKGLLSHFDKPSWNFYEWTDGNDNWLLDLNTNCRNRQEFFDVNLNCAFIIAIEKYKEIKNILGKEFIFNSSEMRKRIKEHFYDAKKGAFKNTVNEEKYSRLGNSLAILAEILPNEESKTLAEKMIDGSGFIDISLSMLTFYYDALLKVDISNKKEVLKDIDLKYSSMLSKGATTFWETIGGPDDFGGSGSLCHGWSAIPVYYFNTLGENINA